MPEGGFSIIIGALVGLVSGLAPHVIAAYKARKDHELAAKKSDLDTLTLIIDELREEIERQKKERAGQARVAAEQEARIKSLEDDCDEKNRLIGQLETQVAGLIREREELESRIASMAEYIELLIATMREYNIPVPDRRRPVNNKGKR
jgi:chromosome segregation ATPase